MAIEISSKSPDRPRVVAIVQARLGSTRLPGKVLLDVAGKPMLYHVLRRTAGARLVDVTVLATADNEQNKPVAQAGRYFGFPVYAGSEVDLVDRFYQACLLHKADIVVRVTADCPLVDPALIDRTIRFYLDHAGNVDYVNCNRPHKLPHGLDVEVFSIQTLETLWREATGTFGREWFITNILDHPERWRMGDIGVERDISQYRWTVDYEEDIDLIRRIFTALDSDERIFGVQDILDLYQTMPELAEINLNRSGLTVEAGIEDAKRKAEQSS